VTDNATFAGTISCGHIGIGEAPSATIPISVTTSTTSFAAKFHNTHATDGHGVYIRSSDDANVNALQIDNVGGTAMFKVAGDGNATFAGDVLPSADNSHDLGAAVGGRWANLYTADIHLNNEGTEGNEIDGTTGDWNIQEGEDDLYLLNRKSGKKYRFKLEEIE